MKTSFKTQSNSMISYVAAGLLAVGAMAAAPGAQAGPGDALTKSVSYGDLNLNSEKGVAVLYSRLRSAAREVCVPFEGRILSNQMLWSKCYDHALSAAVADINKPAVTALHNQSIHQGDQS